MPSTTTSVALPTTTQMSRSEPIDVPTAVPPPHTYAHDGVTDVILQHHQGVARPLLSAGPRR